MVTCAPIACKHKVSGSISLPSRGSFHLSLTVLFAIGHWVVFRLGGWAPRLPTGFHVSGGTLDPLRYKLHFAYGTFTLFGMPFQTASAIYLMSLLVSATPRALPSVWPLSLSLAATQKIDVSFSSYGYLDVSVPRVSLS